MAGLERGPAKRRSKPSEGNTVQRNGRKPPNDFTCLSLFQSLGDEWNSKKFTKWQKFVHRIIGSSRARGSGLEKIGIVAARHVGM